MQPIRRIVGFLFRPDIGRFEAVNRIFYPLTLAGGIFIGTGVSVAVFGGMVYGAFHWLSGRAPLVLPAGLRAVSIALAAFFAADLLAALVHPSAIAFREVLENLPFLAPAFIHVTTVGDRQRILAAVEIAAAAASLAGAAVSLAGLVREARPEFMAGNANVFALLACVLFALTVIAAARRSDRHAWPYLVAASAAAYLVVQSGTRTALPVLVVVPLLAAPLLRFDRRRKIAAAAVLAFGLLAAGFAAAPAVNQRLKSTVADLEQIQEGDMSGSLGQRVILYDVGAELFLERPLLGYGPGNERQPLRDREAARYGETVVYSHLHNAVLTQGLRAGLVGIAALLAVVLVPLVVVARARKDEVGRVGAAFVYALLVIYVSSGVAGLMLGHDIHDAVFLCGLVFGLYLVEGRAVAGPAASRPAN